MIFSARMARCVVAAGLVVGGGVATAAAAQAASLSSQDKTWMVAAHQSNLAEIAAGQDAEKNASDKGVSAMAMMLVSDHTKLDSSLKKLAATYKLTLPSSPTAAQQAALASVKKNSGSAYDKAWVRVQITGHLQAKAAGKQEMADGSASAVLAADRTAAPVVQKHINGLTTLAADLGISTPSSVSAGTGGQAASDRGREDLAIGLTGGGLVLLGSAYTLRRRRPAAARA